ncbi:MAG: DUF2470 domain-containing protein [Pseudomonadota bacterium]
MDEKSVLREVDDDARRLAGTLLRTERHAALATLEPGSGWPMASRVSMATAMEGHAVILISQLSPHFAALQADPRASLLIGSPGKGDPLAHPRMTVAVRAERTQGETRMALRRRFLARHPKASLYADFGDFAFWRLTVERVSLNGGFGKAYEMAGSDLVLARDEGLEAMEESVVEHMNADHADAIGLMAERLLDAPAADWRLASLDPAGLDLVAGDRVARLWFDPPLLGAEEIRPRLVALAKKARGGSA